MVRGRARFVHIICVCETECEMIENCTAYNILCYGQTYIHQLGRGCRPREPHMNTLLLRSSVRHALSVEMSTGQHQRLRHVCPGQTASSRATSSLHGGVMMAFRGAWNLP